MVLPIRGAASSVMRMAIAPPDPVRSFCVRRLSAAATGPPSITPPSSADEMAALRLQAIKLYKELHRLGRDYPDPAYDFNKRLRRAYEKNAKNTDPAAMRKQLELAEHVKKEVLALISLKKYRYLRRTYHANEPPR